MPIYDHVCQKCKTHIEVNLTIKEYEEVEEKYGRHENESVQIPCPECGDWALRDYSFGCAAGIVKGGYKYQYDPAYRSGAENEWIRNEINNTKEILKKGGASQHRPYSNYHITNPEAAGFNKVGSKTAKDRSEVAKKSVGEHHHKVEHARKK